MLFDGTCPPRRAGGRAFLLGAAALILCAPPASALTTVSVTRSGPILGGEDPAFEATVTASFTFDETCVGTVGSECGLRLTLRYDSTNTGIAGQSQVLTGLLFEPLGSADFRDGPPGSGNFGGVVGSESLIGDGAATAASELGSVAINGVSLNNVSAHWGLNPAISLNLPGSFGTHYFSSVGSLFEGLVSPPQSMGTGHLFAGTTSSIEPSPPDGSRFGIVDGATTNAVVTGMGFPSGAVAYAQDEVVANLFYLGTLTGIDRNLVLPTFGTEGLPIPEPGSVALLGMGLLGLLGWARRSRRGGV